MAAEAKDQHATDATIFKSNAHGGFQDMEAARVDAETAARTSVSTAEREVAGPFCANFAIFFAKFCKFLAGSFSAVRKRNFARKYAFDSIFQALQDVHTFAPLQSQNFSKKSVLKISNQGSTHAGSN